MLRGGAPPPPARRSGGRARGGGARRGAAARGAACSGLQMHAYVRVRVRACLCVCVRACVRACGRAGMRACAMHTAARRAPHVEERRAPLCNHPRLVLAVPCAEAPEGVRGLRRVCLASGGEVAFALPPLEGMPPAVAEVADMCGPLRRRDHLVATAQRQPVHVAVHLTW